MNERDRKALLELLRLCEVCAVFVSRGHDWYLGDADNVPGLAAESLIVKIGENVARMSSEFMELHQEVPWSSIKRMRDRLAHHYEGTDYEAVWSTLEVDIPRIRVLLARVLTGQQ